LLQNGKCKETGIDRIEDSSISVQPIIEFSVRSHIHYSQHRIWSDAHKSTAAAAAAEVVTVASVVVVAESKICNNYHVWFSSDK